MTLPIKGDRNIFEIMAKVCQYGLTVVYQDKLTQMLFQDSLQSLIIKLAKALHRIRKRATVQLTMAEAFAYKNTICLFPIVSIPYLLTSNLISND